MDARVIALLALLAPGCIGTSPEQARADELYAMGADDDGDEDHNPGFPCTDCHGPIEGPSFELAGTIYRTPLPDPGASGQHRGEGGIEVHVRDARGVEHVAITNRAGNFMFGDGDEGSTRVEALTFPLEVWVRRDGIEQRMETLIQRERSCSTCHLCAPGECAPGATSVGRVYLEEAP